MSGEHVPIEDLNRVQATKGLREVFEPLCMETARMDGVEDAYSLAEIRQTVANLPAHALPIHSELIEKPWDIALGVDIAKMRNIRDAVRLDGTQASRKPLTDFENEMADTWLRRRHGKGMLKKDDNEQVLDLGDPKVVRIRDQINDFVDFVDRNYPLVWSDYEASIAALSAEEREQITVFEATRKGNVSGWAGNSDRRLSQRSKIIYMHNPEGMLPGLLSDVAIPIGEYGEELATGIARTTISMQLYALRHQQMSAAALTSGNEELLREYTARGVNAEEINAASSLQTHTEGILSVGQAISILTMEKVEGYDDPRLLIKDLADAGLIGKSARNSAMGFIGPMNLSARYMQGAIVHTESGLAFSEGFEELLDVYRARYVAKSILQASSDPSKLLGTMCPVANVNGGVDAISRTFAAEL